MISVATWYSINPSYLELMSKGDKGRKIAEKLRGLEGAWRTQQERQIWLHENIGGGEVQNCSAGNHFAEIQVVEKVTATPGEILISRPQYLLYEGEVVLLVHSGSVLVVTTKIY